MEFRQLFYLDECQKVQHIDSILQTNGTAKAYTKTRACGKNTEKCKMWISCMRNILCQLHLSASMHRPSSFARILSRQWFLNFLSFIISFCSQTYSANQTGLLSRQNTLSPWGLSGLRRLLLIWLQVDLKSLYVLHDCVLNKMRPSKIHFDKMLVAFAQLLTRNSLRACEARRPVATQTSWNTHSHSTYVQKI